VAVLEASILVIGDEILGGFVQDTNSGWLAQRLMQHGIPLSRVHTIPDEHGAIDEALQLELGRSRPRLVVTTGGIGSTPDDLTYEAIARSLGLDLVEEPTMCGRIDGALAWHAEQGVDVTDEFARHMRRMAMVPESATLLEHDGWAPALRIDLDGGVDASSGATIVVLPGVPDQTRRIVDQVVEPRLMAGRNDAIEVRELTHGFPESALNLVFAELVERFPAVKLGSYPGHPMTVRLSGSPEVVEPAFGWLREQVHELQDSPAGRRLADAWAVRSGGRDSERR
jgi:molybdenum cofactor synthesis domain-containing protein